MARLITPGAGFDSRRNIQAVRNAFVGWIAASGCRWCLTLNPNRSKSQSTELDILRKAFGDADRTLLGDRFNFVDARKRLLGFIMPEHVASNLHFHLAIKAGLEASPLEELRRIEVLAEAWSERVPSGTSKIEAITNSAGWSRYITKEMSRG